MPDKFLDKIAVMGLEPQELNTACKHKCYLVELSEDNHILYIPDNVTKMIHAWDRENELSEKIQKLRGVLRVQGGKGLESTDSLFSECELDLLDLNKLDMSNVRNTMSMFENSKIKQLRISKINTSNVVFMQSMFEGFETEYLDLSSLNTTKVISMSQMFYKSKIGKMDITKLNIHRNTSMNEMFRESETETLDLRNVILSERYDNKHILYWAKVKEVIINQEDWIDNSIFYQIDCEAKLTVIKE